MPSNVKLFERYNYNPVFIETGSYVGEGIRNAIFAGYKEIHSVELYDKHYAYCKDLFKYNENVNVYLGDSVEFLDAILPNISSPITFWLDAHYSGGDTFSNGTICPLMRELDVIADHHINTHTIIIDDLREWNKDNPLIGFGVDEIKAKILSINGNYRFNLADGYVKNDILIAEIKKRKPYNVLVFSKDRACQLDLFLRSFQKYVFDSDLYDIHVLYTFSNDEFKKGYDILKEEVPSNVIFIEEKSFKEDVLKTMNRKRMNIGNRFTVFFVDDDVFKEYVNLEDSQEDLFWMDKRILCRSLRLYPGLIYCYPQGDYMTPPSFEDNGVFTWLEEDGDFGYPYSLDGHIFRTGDILYLLVDLNYTNPNSLEGALSRTKDRTMYKMICYPKSIIMNNPINMVQTNNPNKHGSVDATFLNKEFLNNKRLSLEPFRGFKNISCHQIVEPVLVDKNEGTCN
jgi:hypothetical protein